MRGRRPTPTPLRILRGNPQHRPIREDEPAPVGGDISSLMPLWLRTADALEAGIADLTVAELRTRAGELRIEGRSKLSRNDLIEAIQEASVGPREAGWQELEPMLHSMRVITAADVPLLAALINEYVIYIEAHMVIAREGAAFTVETRYGTQQKTRQEVHRADRAWEHILRGFIEFGMSPSSRSRISIVPADEHSAMEGLLDGS